MKTLSKYIFFLLLIISTLSLKAQSNYDRLEWRDSATSMILINANVGYLLNYNTGYWGELFSQSFSAGTNCFFKTSSNWTFDFAFNIMFDGKLRPSVDYKGILGDLVYDNGNVIDANGSPATLTLKGTGWNFALGAGKVIPVSDRWRNSGIWIRVTAGYYGHKINIGPSDQIVALLQEDYKKGFDQLSAGFATSQFIGYLHVRDKRTSSFYAGFEFWEMWTRPSRTYSFMLGSRESLPFKFSGMVGFKVGWIIPLQEKKAVTTLYKY